MVTYNVMFVGGQFEEVGRVQLKGENLGGDDLRVGEDFVLLVI